VHLPPARLGRADRRLRRQEDRRAAARPGGQSTASSRPSPPRAPTPGSKARPRASSAGPYDPADYEQVTTSSMSGSKRLDPRLRARSSARTCPGRPISISKARTSIAAGSIPRCSKLRHRGRAPYEAC
jgi:hypothetical protein